ncbi:GNAT family N-acetyltransferase [Streptomyces sp. NPDC057543]|uniref:GNAT family N-acetyltransferase n=1 Tax=Streptomyces sp. NPDC057543 TaxID=3346163 RepID=UPI0036ACF0D5
MRTGGPPTAFGNGTPPPSWPRQTGERTHQHAAGARKGAPGRSEPGDHALGRSRSLTATRERIERDSDDGDRDDFLVLLPDSTPIGHIALSGQNIVKGTAQVELMLAPEHRGHGHGTDAFEALVDLAFGELPMHRLTAETHTDNAAARAVLAKSGFVHEGFSRAACLHRGRRHDLAVFSLLRPEWEELNRPRAWDA